MADNNKSQVYAHVMKTFATGGGPIKLIQFPGHVPTVRKDYNRLAQLKLDDNVSLLNELNGLVLRLPKKLPVDIKGLFSRDDLCAGVSLYRICHTGDTASAMQIENLLRLTAQPDEMLKWMFDFSVNIGKIFFPLEKKIFLIVFFCEKQTGPRAPQDMAHFGRRNCSVSFLRHVFNSEVFEYFVAIRSYSPLATAALRSHIEEKKGGNYTYGELYADKIYKQTTEDNDKSRDKLASLLIARILDQLPDRTNIFTISPSFTEKPHRPLLCHHYNVLAGDKDNSEHLNFYNACLFLKDIDKSIGVLMGLGREHGYVLFKTHGTDAANKMPIDVGSDFYGNDSYANGFPIGVPAKDGPDRMFHYDSIMKEQILQEQLRLKSKWSGNFAIHPKLLPGLYESKVLETVSSLEPYTIALNRTPGQIHQYKLTAIASYISAPLENELDIRSLALIFKAPVGNNNVAVQIVRIPLTNIMLKSGHLLGLWVEALAAKKQAISIDQLILSSDQLYMYLNDQNLVNLLSASQESEHNVYLKV